MILAIRHAVRVDKVGVKRLSKLAGVTDHAVTRLADDHSEISGDNLSKLYRAAEELVDRKRADDDEIKALLEWASGQPRSWLANESGYDPSNLRKFLAGKIRPRRVLARIQALRIAQQNHGGSD